MQQEAAFLQAMRDNPNDDLTRLVYADWLEEQGDARGRYLRVEVELARIAEDDARYAELEAGLVELRADVEPDWLEVAEKRYDLVLHAYSREYTIRLIKIARELTRLGLKEMKGLFCGPLPGLVLASVARQDAELGRKRLRCGQGKQIAEVEICVAGRPPC